MDESTSSQSSFYDLHEPFPSGSDPFEWIETFRDRRTSKCPAHGDYWLITTAEDYLEIIRNTDDFKSLSTIPPTEIPRPLIPIFVDPPEHTVYRQFMTPVLSPTSVRGWEDFTRGHARDMIDGFVADGRCDAVGDYARPLPLEVFGMLMDLDQETIASIKGMVLAGADYENPSTAAVMGMAQALGGIIEERIKTANNGEDMPRQLARASVSGRTLSPQEIFDILHTMFVAGFDTAAGMLAISLRFLATNSEARATLVASPERIPEAVEEIVRLHAFVQSSRTVRVDTQAAGVAMKAGDQVLLPTSLPNRDPEAFENPHEFDLDRSPNRHYGFGAGPHRCVGSHLARMELKIGIEEWLRQIPEFQIADGFTPTFRPGHVITVDELLLEW